MTVKEKMYGGARIISLIWIATPIIWVFWVYLLGFHARLILGHWPVPYFDQPDRTWFNSQSFNLSYNLSWDIFHGALLAIIPALIGLFSKKNWTVKLGYLLPWLFMFLYIVLVQKDLTQTGQWWFD